MEKQDLDNLQRATKDYSESSAWLSHMIFGILFMVFGLLPYLKMQSVTTILLLLILIGGWVFISKYLTRALMRKGLGYVEGKKEVVPPWQDILRMMLGLIMMFILVFISSFMLKIQSDIRYLIMLLAIGFISVIVGLINRKKGNVFYIVFYTGIYFIVCGITSIEPMKHIFYAYEMAPMEICFISLGLGLILSGIIRYFEYKKIVQKVKGTN